MGAVILRLFPALQTVTVQHMLFPGSHRGVRYASMSHQDVRKRIGSDLTMFLNWNTETFWRLVVMERTSAFIFQ